MESWTKEEENKAYQLISLLELHDESQEFLSPVDYKKLNLPMYPTIIKRPMDLGTIKKRIKSHNYLTLQDFIAEVQLVWDNCKKYNDQSTDIYHQAVYLEKQTKRYCGKLRIPFPSSGKSSKHEELNDPKIVTFEEKWRITEAIKKVNQGVLEQIIKILDEKSPEAVERLDVDNKMKIKLDVLSRETFLSIQEVVDEFNCENLPQKRGNKVI